MALSVALVADDLTGALDAAAPFAGCGLRVTAHRHADSLPAPARPAEASPAPDEEYGSPQASRFAPPGRVLAVSTSSRHLAPAAAHAAVMEAGRQLRPWCPRLAFKKIDSTLRGPIPDEVAAAMEAFGRETAIVCPAFPAAGRVVRNGEVLVYGEPLRETEYARDLRTPAPAISLATLFGGIGKVRGLRPGEALRDCPAAGVVIADAETESHLALVAALASERAREVLAVGSDGLAAALASRFGRSGPVVRVAGGGGRVVLYALGSRTRTTAEQAERLLEAHPGTPVVDAPAGVLDPEAIVRASSSSRTVVAQVPETPRGEPGAVARTFAEGVRTAIACLGGPGCLAALVATGGDTVEAILDAFGIEALDVLGEFRPGIPVSRAAAGAGDLILVSKAGGFGTPELFAEIAGEATGS